MIRIFETENVTTIISYNIVSIFIASSYVGGDSSIQYLGAEFIPSSRTDSFFPALQIQIFIT